MASSPESAPIKTVQLEGKIIAITGANRVIYSIDIGDTGDKIRRPFSKMPKSALCPTSRYFTAEEIDQLWGVILYGSFYSARCAAGAFVKQGVKDASSSPRAGVRHMAQCSIRVNSVSPRLQQPLWEQQFKYYGGMPRLAAVEDLGSAYVYLLSEGELHYQH
ncbi:hypothetical protein BKA63DRAFT_535488 [Paraphoma chrysanthemicola]|nr:hypothetical protein BKA63DRAFT_535488 [Paraphoma chrysanthemicola]